MKRIKNNSISYLLTFVLTLFFGACEVLAQQDVIRTGYPQAIGIHGGTSGIGAHFYQPFSAKFGARLGVSFMPFNTDIKGTYSGRKTHSDIKAQAHNASLILGYTPFAGKGGFFNSFGLQLGGAYFFKLDGEFDTRLSDPYKYGDILVDPVQVGIIHTDVKWKKTINPYAGIGWSNIRLDDRFSASLDLGCYYLSKPKVTIEASGLLEENVMNAPQVEHNIRNYRYLPRVEFGVSYRLK